MLGVIAAAPLAAVAGGANRCAGEAPAGSSAPLSAAIGADPKPAAADSLAALSQQAFSQQLRTRFALRRDADSQPISVVLADMVDYKARCGHGATSRVTLESFSLSFTCEQPALPQGVYTLEHRELGSFALLLVPSADGRALEAVINRLHA